MRQSERVFFHRTTTMPNRRRSSAAPAQDPRQIRTRDALHAALLQLLKVKALDQITILDICETAGIGYRTFFRHHPTKEALLKALAAEQIQRLVAMTLPVVDEVDMDAAYIAMFEYVAENRALWFALLTGGAAGAMREEFLKVSREVAAARTTRNAWPPTEISVIFSVTSTIELLTWWLRQKKPMPVQEIAAIHRHLIVRPTQQPAPKPKQPRRRPK